MRSYRFGSLTRRIPGAAPELSLRGSSAAHGLLALRAGWAVGVALFFAGFEAAGGEAFAETAALLEGLALRGNLAFEHIQGAADDEQHGVGRHRGVLRIQPAGVFPALFERVLGGLVDHVVLERRGVDGNGVHSVGFFGVDGPRQLAAVDDEDFVIAAQLAEAGAGDVGEFHFRVLGGGRAFRAFDDVLASAAGGLGHLVVLAALGVVEFFWGLAVVVRQETAAESQGFELHERGERERM